jgi:hypothetical protein
VASAPVWWLFEMTTVTTPCASMRARARSVAFEISQAPGRRRPFQVTQPPRSAITSTSPLSVMPPAAIASRYHGASAKPCVAWPIASATSSDCAMRSAFSRSMPWRARCTISRDCCSSVLHRHESHVGSLHGLAGRRSIGAVVLASLAAHAIRRHELGRHEFAKRAHHSTRNTLGDLQSEVHRTRGHIELTCFSFSSRRRPAAFGVRVHVIFDEPDLATYRSLRCGERTANRRAV